MATSNWEYTEDLISAKTDCDECGGSLVASHDLPNEVTIYTRNGTKFAQHYLKECPNRWCTMITRSRKVSRCMILK